MSHERAFLWLPEGRMSQRASEQKIRRRFKTMRETGSDRHRLSPTQSNRDDNFGICEKGGYRWR